MPSESTTRDALYDIRDNILLARHFVAALNFDTFKLSRLHFYAVTRAIEIISEASRRLPNDLRDRSPDLPWRANRDAGNFYRHDYDNVAESRVWDTVHHELTPLLNAVSREIDALDAP